MTKLTVASFEDVVAPVVELNKVALGYNEKLAELNMTLLRKQADAALSGWRAALSVKDADEAKEYLTAQSGTVSGLLKGYVDDVQAVSQMNQDVAEDVRKVVTESVEKVSKQAA